jgi:nucleotide-binding universal stress UspA family protein
MKGARVLVASQRGCPEAALHHAASFAGRDGEVVLASVVVVPHGQPLWASLGRAVDDACAALDAGEGAAGAARSFDTRLVRGRSFADAVLELAGDEDFDVIVLEGGPASPGSEDRAQVEAVIGRASATVVLVRPATSSRPPSTAR